MFWRISGPSKDSKLLYSLPGGNHHIFSIYRPFRDVASQKLGFFSAEADVKAYEELLPLGLFSGVTTNPGTLGRVDL